MDVISKLYYEAHVTIEPVFDERREQVSELATTHGFKLAELLMKKRAEDTEERSSKDTFMTAHSRSLNDITQRTVKAVVALQIAGYKVHRYKIEDTVLDSRHADGLGLLMWR